MALAAGTILGQCEIRSPLGAGGMGEVYRAHDTRLNREVAIKVLPESVSSDPERLRRFEQEARAAQARSDPVAQRDRLRSADRARSGAHQHLARTRNRVRVVLELQYFWTAVLMDNNCLMIYLLVRYANSR
jgi:serine/threonine protein kinase